MTHDDHEEARLWMAMRTLGVYLWDMSDKCDVLDLRYPLLRWEMLASDFSLGRNGRMDKGTDNVMGWLHGSRKLDCQLVQVYVIWALVLTRGFWYWYW